MSLALSQSKTALAAGLTASFLATGGNPPYTYSVLPDGAGGSINSVTGVYTAPEVVDDDPKKSFDTIQAIDASNNTVISQILVALPLGLVCEIIQREMGLANGRVYFWNQKIMQPTDNDLYIAVSILRTKPFGNTTPVVSDVGGLSSVGSVNVMAQLSIDAISRGPSALNRKEEILLALGSIYSQSQQEMNSFSIGRIPPGGQFVNLSNVDGAAIPYRFNISVNIQYFVKKTKPVLYYDNFDPIEINIDPEED